MWAMAALLLKCADRIGKGKVVLRLRLMIACLFVCSSVLFHALISPIVACNPTKMGANHSYSDVEESGFAYLADLAQCDI